jgi:hypothetical protein
VQRAPVDGLHCSLVIGELLQRFVARSRPDEELVIVASGRQLVLVMETPPEATDLLPVVHQLHIVIIMGSQVSHEDRLVFAT